MGLQKGRREGVVTTRVTLWPAGALSWGLPSRKGAMGWLSLLSHYFTLLRNTSGWKRGRLSMFRTLQVLTEP